MKGFILVMLVCFCITGVIVTADSNLVALHKSTSPVYNQNCLTRSCHDSLIQNEKSLDPRVEAIHQKMIPYTPGYNPRKGVGSATCRHCHRSVDLINKSAATLNKNVSSQVCVICHTTSGPGKTLYK